MFDRMIGCTTSGPSSSDLGTIGFALHLFWGLPWVSGSEMHR